MKKVVVRSFDSKKATEFLATILPSRRIKAPQNSLNFHMLISESHWSVVKPDKLFAILRLTNIEINEYNLFPKKFFKLAI